MKMRIYTTSVISRGIYTPKVFFSFIWYALKNPGLGLGGRGVNRVPNTRKNCFWRINATRNDIRAIDTNFHEIGLRFLRCLRRCPFWICFRCCFVGIFKEFWSASKPFLHDPFLFEFVQWLVGSSETV